MKLITKSPQDPVEWIELFDEMLFVRLYVNLGEENPERAVRQTLATTTTPQVLESISDLTVQNLATRAMANPVIGDAIAQHLGEQIYRERKIGVQWILDCTTEVYERCMQMTRVKTSDGMPIFAKFNPLGALRALELAGKHVDIQAFKEVIEHESGPNLTEVLEQARKRLESGSVIKVIPGVPVDGDAVSPAALNELPPDQVQANIARMDELLGETGYSV